MLEHFSLPAEKKEEGSEFMKRQILLCLFLYASFAVSAQNSEVKMNCRVLTPEEYGGNGYIVSHKDLIDGAFVEVTNLSNLKKSTAVVRRNTAVDRQGLVSGVLAVNLGIPFNGSADVSIRYISFLNSRDDVYAPFYTGDETDRSRLEAVIAEKKQQQEQEEEVRSAGAPAATGLPTVADEAVLPGSSVNEKTERLPIPEWKEAEEARLVLNERKENPSDHSRDGEWNRSALPDPALFEMSYIDERLLRDGTEQNREAPLPELEIESPGYVWGRTDVSRGDSGYTRTVDEIPVWKQEMTTESYMPRPRNVTVSVNGKEIGLTHYPEIESDCYRIVDDKTQVKKINELFRLDRISLPETAVGTGVEDPIGSEESYTPGEVAEPRIVQVPIGEPQTVTEEPQTVTEEPQTVTEEPQTVTEEPQTVTEEPQTVTEEPQTVTEESQTVTEEPQTVTEEPQKIIIEEPKRPESPLISGALYLQTGAFLTEAAAENRAAKLREIFPTVVFRTETDGRVMYKVAVGPVTPDEIGVIRLYLKSLRISDAFPIIGR